MDEQNEKYEAVEKKPDQSEDIGSQSDDTLLETPQEDFSKGIETEEYDILPEMEETAEELDILKGKEGVEVRYSFNGNEVRQGLKLFQRETIYKKNAVYSVILLAIFMIYTVNIIRNPSEAFSVFLAALCLAVLMFLWYLPAKHVKKTAEAADKEEMWFTMTVYDNCVRIKEERGGFIIEYGKEISKIFETLNLFLICVGKERIFILPKRFLTDGREEKIRDLFQNGMGEQFVTVKVKE